MEAHGGAFIYLSNEVSLWRDHDFFRYQLGQAVLAENQPSCVLRLSSENAFLSSQYMLIRGLRTLNGKLVQQRLSKYYSQSQNRETLPIPSAISYYHFMDESHHFNTSKIIGLEVTNSLPPPTKFEKWIVNQAVQGCQKDHFHFSPVVNGIFWYDPAIFKTIYTLFRSKHFEMDDQEAKEMLKKCFAEDNEGIQRAKETHAIAAASYKAFVEEVDHLSAKNKEMHLLSQIEIVDRSLIEVGDDVIFGHKAAIVSHAIIKKKSGVIKLYVKKVRIGSGAFIGAGSKFGPGTVIAPNQIIPFETLLTINKRV